ncbi:MAG: tetratricopeptide repeat protein [Bryobacteraceae bacterium]
MVRFALGFAVSCCLLFAGPSPEAQTRYERTDYNGALEILLRSPGKDAAVYALIGKSYFHLGDFKGATDAFEQASAAAPQNSEYVHWLGRAYGRRAESGNPFTAPGYASRARQCFERSVRLDPTNREAINDLFDYYLQAPGFLGGGFQKAAALVPRIAALDPAEGHYAEAQLADKRKEFDAAEKQLRRAMELAPRQVGRAVDLAKYLAKRGRVQESEAVFDQAQRMAPDSPKILFERAHTYIQEGRNLGEARSLLERYLQCSLTPDDPPKAKAWELLKETRSGA